MPTDKIVPADLGEGRQRKLALSVADAAYETGVGRDTIYAAIRNGRLEAKKFGRRTLITANALQRFLDGLPPLRLPSASDDSEKPPRRRVR